MRYDYKCTKCKHTEEIWHSIKEEKEYSCPKCESIMERSFGGGTGFILKGIGWARNNTATAPTAKRYKVRELVGPSFLRKCIKK